MSIARVPKVIRFLSVLALLGCAAMAQQASPPAENPPSLKVGDVSVAVDPSTGRLVPQTIEQRRKLAEALATLLVRRTDDLVVELHPNGMRSIDLQGRFQNMMLIRKMPDGSFALQCATEPEAAMTLPSTSPSTPEEK